MAADRTNAGSRSSDVPAQKQEIDQHLNRFHSRAMLRQAHPIDPDHAFSASITLGCRFDSGAAQARLTLKVLPRTISRAGSKIIKTVDMLFDKFMIEHGYAAINAARIFLVDQ